MLTDAELQAIADEYVANTERPYSTGREVLVERVFNLTKPPGTYFILVPQKNSPQTQPGILQGEPIEETLAYMAPVSNPEVNPLGEGFFVFRDTGDVQAFSSTEFHDARHQIGNPGYAPTPGQVEYILTRYKPERGPGGWKL